MFYNAFVWVCSQSLVIYNGFGDVASHVASRTGEGKQIVPQALQLILGEGWDWFCCCCCLIDLPHLHLKCEKTADRQNEV